MLLDILAKKPDKATLERLDAMGPKVWKQVERMMRQHLRLRLRGYDPDRGFDTLNQLPIVLSKEPVPVDDFLEI